MTKREIIKYFKAKGIEVEVTYLGYTIHHCSKVPHWRVSIPIIDSYDNEKSSYDMCVWESLSNVFDEIDLFVSIYWNEKRKCLVF